MSTPTATEFGTDTHGNTRASQDSRASRALRRANDQIARAFYDDAERRDPEAMAEARAEWTTGREYRDLIADADLTGRADATPTTWADLACDAAGRSFDAATRAMRGC